MVSHRGSLAIAPSADPVAADQSAVEAIDHLEREQWRANLHQAVAFDPTCVQVCNAQDGALTNTESGPKSSGRGRSDLSPDQVLEVPGAPLGWQATQENDYGTAFATHGWVSLSDAVMEAQALVSGHPSRWVRIRRRPPPCRPRAPGTCAL